MTNTQLLNLQNIVYINTKQQLANAGITSAIWSKLILDGVMNRFMNEALQEITIEQIKNTEEKQNNPQKEKEKEE
jgi:hypothetical protein